MPVVRAALELGLYVITVDNVPGNIGHRHSHCAVNCSTTDLAGVLAAARDHKIDGIVTFASDVATQAVGYIVDQLGLNGCNLAVAKTMSNKAMFRAFQQQHDGELNYPHFAAGESLAEIAEAVAALSLPLVFKPVDTSGSRGIVRVAQKDWDTYRQAFAYAQSFARSHKVCVEEYVEGCDVSGDGFLVDGKLSALITHKRTCEFVPTGHSLPTDLSAADQARVFAEVTAHCTALGYRNGPLDFDARVATDRVVVLEMSPRLGGNGIPMIMSRATNVDVITALLRFAVGEDIAVPPELEVIRSCGSWVIGVAESGRLVSLASEQELKAGAPEVFEYAVHYHLGDEVPEFIHSGNSLGYVLFDIPDRHDYSQVLSNVQRAMHLAVSHQ
jgi:biotin carboxylase